jgi:hypothetical protein
MRERLKRTGESPSVFPKIFGLRGIILSNMAFNVKAILKIKQNFPKVSAHNFIILRVQSQGGKPIFLRRWG